MTLIQTITTDDITILVADRRLTNASTGTIVDDDHTKLVCWNMSYGIGFTGLARINPAQTKSTSEWIAETICDYPDFMVGVQALGWHMREQMKKLPKWWPDKRLGIVVAGYDGEDISRKAWIHNFGVDPTDIKLQLLVPHPGQTSSYHISGGPLVNDWHRRVLQRRIPRLLKQPNGIARAVRVMVALQRELANANTGIGTDAMVVTIPRTRAKPMLLSNVDGNATGGTGACEFHYYDTNGYDYRQLGPHVAGGHMAWGDCIATADPDNPDNQTISWRVLKWPTPPPTTMPADES
jgi:hypothetical protein